MENMENKKDNKVVIIILIIIILVLLGIICYLIMNKPTSINTTTTTKKTEEKEINNFENTIWHVNSEDSSSTQFEFLPKNIFKATDPYVTINGTYRVYKDIVVLESEEDVIPIVLYIVDDKLCSDSKCSKEEGILVKGEKKKETNNDEAKLKNFNLFSERLLTAVETQFVYDNELGALEYGRVYIYDISSDLAITSIGDYKGYIIVDAFHDGSEPKYYLYLHDSNYMVLGDGEVKKYNSEEADKVMSTAVKVCLNKWDELSNGHDARSKEYQKCYNRQGYLLLPSTN